MGAFRQSAPLVRAMNVLLNRPARDIAVAAASTRGRMYTAVPWQGHVLVGTWQADAIAAADDHGDRPEDLAQFVENSTRRSLDGR